MRRWPATRPTTASWNRPPRSAASACTPPSSTTRSYAPAAPSPRPCASSRAPAPRSCARSWRARASTTSRPAGARRPTPSDGRGAADGPARVPPATLIALFDAPLLADAGLVEARVVRKALRAAAEGEPLPLDGLADLVSTELWLRRLLSRRGTCWTGTAAPRQRAVRGRGRRRQRGRPASGRGRPPGLMPRRCRPARQPVRAQPLGPPRDRRPRDPPAGS